MRALKTFGLGILWALLLPLLLVAIVFIGVFGAVNFLVEFTLMVVNFFRGKKLFPWFPEDEKAYAILQKAIEKQSEATQTPPPQPQPQQVFVQQNFYTDPSALAKAQGMLPPNMNQGALPPSYNSPASQIPNALPPAPEEEVYPRPQLSSLPQFDPLKEDNDVQQIEIDVEEGGNDHE